MTEQGNRGGSPRRTRDASGGHDVRDVEIDVEVAVIGAGVSGLVAARELDRRGVSVAVLESAPQVGGRTRAETTVLGSRIDLGGQWVGSDHDRFRRLAADLGATIYPMHSPAAPALLRGGDERSDPARLLADAEAVLAAWTATAAAGIPEGWSRITVAEQLEREVSDAEVRRLLEVMIPLMTTADLDRYAMADWAEVLRPAGNLDQMMSTTGGAQDGLVLEGAGTLAERMAEALQDRVLLDRRVESVVHDGDRVVLGTAAGDVVADQVVVSVPPPMLARVRFEPALPEAAASLISGTYMGSVYKAIAVYERPFWRDRAEAESYLVDRPGGCLFDTSPPEGPGHLCVLIGGAEARDLDALAPEGRRAAILSRLTGLLGDEVAEPLGWHEKSWHLDAHVGGGYEALPEFGAEGGRLEDDPARGIFWAGTETASEHPGYIEGAIESGERAAAAVLAVRGQGRSNTPERAPSHP